MKCIAAIFLVAVAFLKTPTDALAKEEASKSKDEVFASLQGAIGKVKEHYESRPSVEKEIIEGIRKNINRLDDGLTPNNVSSIYLASLNNDAFLLYDAAKTEDFSISFKNVQTVMDDTSAKWASLSSDLGFIGSTWNGLLKVSVETSNSGKPVPNLLVRMNMAGLPDQKPSFINFPGLTSPVNGNIPPGEYVVFIVGDNDKIIARQVVTVKGAQEDIVKIQVLIP